LGVPVLAALVADVGAGLGGGGAPFADLALRNNSRPSSINLFLSSGLSGIRSLLRVALASSPRFRSSVRSFDVNGLLRGGVVFTGILGSGSVAVVSSRKPFIERAVVVIVDVDSLTGDDGAIDRVVVVIVDVDSLTGDDGAIDRVVVVIVDVDSLTGDDGAIDRGVLVIVGFDSLTGDGAIDRAVVVVVGFASLTLCGWVLGLALAAGSGAGTFGVDLGGAKVDPLPFGIFLDVALDRGDRHSLTGDGAIAPAVVVIVGFDSLTLCGWVLGLALAAGLGAGAFGVDLEGAKVDPLPFGTLLDVALGRGDRHSLAGDGALDRAGVVIVGFDSLTGDGAIDRVVVVIVGFGSSV
jgi:hypothetical protein